MIDRKGRGGMGWFVWLIGDEDYGGDQHNNLDADGSGKSRSLIQRRQQIPNTVHSKRGCKVDTPHAPCDNAHTQKRQTFTRFAELCIAFQVHTVVVFGLHQELRS
jgi:hypothetical protein